MLFEVLASGILAMVNPADPTRTTMYPSGFKDIDKHVFGAPPSTKLPLLAMSYYLKDKSGRSIPPGYYKVSVSQDKKYILFFQNHFIKGVFKVLNSKKLNEPLEINSARAKNYNNDSMLIILRQDNHEYHSIVPIIMY